MAERLDGVLSELLAAQNETAPEPTPEEIPTTEPAAEGGNDAVTEGTTEAAMTEEGTAPTPPITEGEVQDNGGEVPPTPAPDPQVEALARATEAINGVQRENQELRATLQRMQQMMEQQQRAQHEANRANEEAIAEAVLEPPVLDFEAVQYMSDAERQNALAKYNTAMAEYTKQGIMKELQPIVDQYQRQTKEAADTAVKNQLIGSGKFEGFSEDAEQIEKIIASTPGLSDLPPEMRYALGYVINRGVKAMNTKPAAPESVDSLVARVLQNPEAMKAIEKERVSRIAQSNRSAPPVAASQGQANAPALSQNPPSNLNEARARAFKMLGLK